jgi:CRP-like cAMP-binding protein
MLVSLAAIVKEESYRAGQPIYREDDDALAMYLVQTGEVEIRKSFRRHPDRFKILTIVEENDFFGDLAFFGKARRSADAVARTDTRLWKLDYDDLIRIKGSDTASAVNILQVILRMLVPKLNSLIEEHAVLFELGRLIPKILDVEELTTENAFHNSHLIFLETVCTLTGEKLHDLERKQEDLLKKRLAQGKLSADI